MNHGRIVERGTHKELLAKRGFYADRYNSPCMGADIEIDEKAREAEKTRVAAEAAARMAARLAAAGGPSLAGGTPRGGGSPAGSASPPAPGAAR